MSLTSFPVKHFHGLYLSWYWHWRKIQPVFCLIESYSVVCPPNNSNVICGRHFKSTPIPCSSSSRLPVFRIRGWFLPGMQGCFQGWPGPHPAAVVGDDHFPSTPLHPVDPWHQLLARELLSLLICLFFIWTHKFLFFPLLTRCHCLIPSLLFNNYITELVQHLNCPRFG